MKLCYTAIFGGYDTLKEPEFITPGWEYICWSDAKFKSKNWKVLKVDSPFDRKKLSRYNKIYNPIYAEAVGYSESIWFDASIQIKGNLDELIKPAADFDGMVLKHPHRNTVYQEAIAVVKRQKDSQSCVSRQMEKYRMENFIQMTPLVATGILYRKNNERTREFSRIWWEQVQQYSHRDQLSFNYALQKTLCRFLVSHMNIYDKNNPYFLLHKHNR